MVKPCGLWSRPGLLSSCCDQQYANRNQVSNGNSTSFARRRAAIAGKQQPFSTRAVLSLQERPPRVPLSDAYPVKTTITLPSLGYVIKTQ